MLRPCTACQSLVDWGAQITEWMNFHGEAWKEFAILDIRCDVCHNSTGVMELSEEDFE